MVDTSNAWPNYYVGFLWLIVFFMFTVGQYPHEGKNGK